MSVKDLFGKKSTKLLSATSINELGEEVESADYVRASLVERERYVPEVDFTEISNFAKFGSAEKYYEDAVDKIVKSYPYDGSLYEKLDWHNSSSNFQNYFFEEEYPRTTGYVNIGYDYGTLGASSDGYQQASTNEYIFFKGSINAGDTTTNTLSDLFETSNKYDPEKNRGNNLEIDGNNGLTVEFWLKKNNGGGSDKQAIFDLWNSSSFGTDSYARFRVEIHPGISGEEEQIYLEISSGSAGVFETGLGTSLDITGSEWHHYAVTAINTGSQLSIKLYVDGALNDSAVTGSSIGTVTGSLNGTIGSLITSVSGTHGDLGWGKLSGSIDEIRYWKSKRSDKKIGRYWFTQVGGGTNTDDANIDLGLYYKFNEGIFNTSSISSQDSRVLDYSGRVSNGTWEGYTLGSRNSGSAIEESGASSSEFKDPIIYSEHPSVKALKQEKMLLGNIHDRDNSANFFNTFPNWIIEEDAGGLNNLSQIISEYFDDLYLKIEALPRLKDISYRQGKQLPFASRLLDSIGFTAPELFTDVSALEFILSRDEDKNFEEKISNIRNQIYQNIYNNIVYIYRSKGTEKSIRNLIRCFGIDDEIINLNMYADDVTYTYEDRYRYTNVKKKYINLNGENRLGSTVYQMTSSNPQSYSYIEGNVNAGYLGTTYQTEVIFPIKAQRCSPLYFACNFLTTSLFGMHEADSSTPGDTTWFGSDRANLQVYSVRPEKESDNVRFFLTSSYLGLNLTSSLYKEVYNDEKWNFTVRMYQEKYPLADGVIGSGEGDYIVEFQGINTVLDVIQNEFKITASVSQALGEGHMSANKRIYLGSHRQNFTGSVLPGGDSLGEFSDVKVSSVRYWLNNLSDEVVREHSKDVMNFGSESPYSNVESFDSTGLNGTFVPQMKTLALHWDFETVTGSDSNSEFVVDDLTSGSLTTNGFGWIGDISRREHTGRGSFFPSDEPSGISQEYVYSAEHRLPEVLNSDDLIEIRSQDDDYFSRDSRPVNHQFLLEKSMYYTISREMVKFFGTVKDFNNLVGEPINRYRQEYRSINSLRSLFFQEVQNTPDFEKYIELYKWIDNAINQMVRQLIPASADFGTEELANIVESHILERNKYWNKLPTIENKIKINKDNPNPIKAINELKYNWKKGHAPIGLNENNNCDWWLLRAERDSNTGTDLNSERQGIFDAALSALNRKFSTVYDLEADAVTIIDLDPKTPAVTKQITKFGSGEYLLIEIGDLPQIPDCDDE